MILSEGPFVNLVTMVFLTMNSTQERRLYSLSLPD